MQSWSVVADLLFLLAAALVLGTLFERFRQSALLGYLSAGLLLGPGAFGAVAQGGAVSFLGELGVSMLLFTIGLEVSWARLKATGRAGLLGGALQVAVTFTATVGGCVTFGQSLATSLLLGAILVTSNTACVLRLLQTRGDLDTRYGRNALGILLVQDLGVIPIVVVVGILASAGAGDVGTSLLRAGGGVIAMVLGLGVMFHAIIPRALGMATALRNRELPILLAVVSGLGAAFFARWLGLSPALGAFLAGMMLASSPYATLVRADVGSLRTVLVTLFFAAVGMLADPMFTLRNLPLVVGVVVGTLVVKSAIIFGILRVLGRNHRESLASGLVLAQYGEYAFVFLEVGRAGLLSESLLQVFASASIATLFLTPLLVSLAGRIAGKTRAALSEDGPTVEEPRQDHVLVIGFGPAGKALVTGLVVEGLPVEVVDSNAKLVERARSLGVGARIGDGTHPEILEAVHARAARAVVVTVPDVRVAVSIARQLAPVAPNVPILARARYRSHVADLEAAGVMAVDEEGGVGDLLLQSVVSVLARSPV